MTYEKQLEKKQEKMNVLFSSLASPLPIIGMDNPLHYRNKVQVRFGKEGKTTVTGNYVRDSHTLVPIRECMISDETSLKIIRSVERIVNALHIPVFDEHVYKGTVRHLLIRSTSLGEYMVVFVTGNTPIREEKELVKRILQYNPEVTTILQNINPNRTSMVLGEKTKVLYGKGYVTDELLGFRFRISASSFYQVNKRQTAVLYGKAVEFADLKGDERVIDAYCGTGTIGILMSAHAKEVTGVEINKNAVRDAFRNAEDNHVKNITFIAEDAGRYMRKLAKEGETIDLLMMDPPRSGSDETFLQSVCTLSPKKIVYISCGPESLKRDLLYLKKGGYEIRKLQPVALFPFTDHVETVVLLSRK